jgi:hypothetical protein
MNRQRLLLFCLLILLALAMVWSYARIPRQKTVAALKFAPGQQAPHVAVRRGEGAGRQKGANSLRLDLLEREAFGFRGYRRNLFKPIFVDEIKAARLRAAAAAFKPRPLQRPLPLPMVVPPPPRRELAMFTFLGFLQKDNRKTVFLSRDGEIILVRKGDTFGGRFQAASITDQALTIKVADTGEEIVIPLVEFASLFPAP